MFTALSDDSTGEGIAVTSTTSPTRRSNPRGQGEQLRHDLIEAAGELLLTTRDATPFSLRAVAKTVGVSPTAVYRHFDSANALVEAVLIDQSDALRTALQPAQPAGEAAPTLTELGLRYARWGLANPGAYQLLFESAERIGHRGGVGGPGWDMIDALGQLLGTTLGINEPAANVLAIRAWSLLHGLTSLRLHKPTMAWPTTVEQEVAAIAAALLEGARPREV